MARGTYYAVAPTPTYKTGPADEQRRGRAIAIGLGLLCCLLVTVCAAVAGALTAAAQEGPLYTPDMQTVLALHNGYRAQHGVPPLVWDEGLAQDAAAWAARCIMAHEDPLLTSKSEGENLASDGGTGVTQSSAVTSGVQGWYDEFALYSYADPGFSEATGHFTQLVWRDTTRVGCAVQPGCPVLGYIMSCRYQPPGNVVGEDWTPEVPPPV